MAVLSTGYRPLACCPAQRAGAQRLCALAIVGLDRDVLDADMLLMVLVGDDRRHVELHAVQVELAAAAGNFPFHGRAEIVDVELRDLLRILSGLDVDVPELHGHARFLPLEFTKRADATPAACSLAARAEELNRHCQLHG